MAKTIACIRWGDALTMSVLREGLLKNGMPPRNFLHMLTDQGIDLESPIFIARIRVDYFYWNSENADTASREWQEIVEEIAAGSETRNSPGSALC